MVATTAPTDRLAPRSAWIATFTVSTGCSTRLTSVPATAPATAFTLTATRPLTPGVSEPRSHRPSLGRVVARVATRGRSGFDGDAPSCRRIWSARSRNPLLFRRRADQGRAGSRDDLAGTARSMTRSGVTSRGCGAPRRRSESLNLTGGTAQKCRLITLHPVRMARSTHRFLHQSRRIMHGKPPHRRSEPRARHRGALLRSAVHARATRRDRCGLRAALPLALGSRPPRGRARARDGDGEEGEAVGEHQEAPGEEDLVHGGEAALLACFKCNFEDDARCAGERRALDSCLNLAAKQPKKANTINYHLQRLSRAARR